MGEPAVDLGTLMEDAVLLREDILHRLCEAIQLTATQRERAESAYRGVGRWLEAEGSPFEALEPRIYPQGSMALRNTTKPLPQEEHDLDFVVELNSADRYNRASDLLDDTRDRLLEHGEYAEKVDRKDRDHCVRLNYRGNFHLDIVPAFRQFGEEGTIWVPDRRSGGFSRGNPKRYIAWFEERCSVEASRVLLKSMEALPDYDAPEIELPLRRCTQLLKRWRDVAFQDSPGSAPSSILLTTLAANHYQQEWSVGDTLSGLLDRLVLQVESTPGPLDIRHPFDDDEDGEREKLSNSWLQNESEYSLFVDRLREFVTRWKSLPTTSGFHNVSSLLAEMFGETPARSALTGHQEALVNAPRKQGRLGFVPGTAAVTSTGVGRGRTRSNTFFGD